MPLAAEEMRERKRAEFAALKKTLEANLRFKDVELNNALLASFATYTQLVPAFEKILAEEGGDLEKFYSRVKATAASAPSSRGPLSTPSR